MAQNDLRLWAAILLLVGGVVHLIPSLYNGLAQLTNGYPWIQIVVGMISVIIALVLLARKDNAA